MAIMKFASYAPLYAEILYAATEQIKLIINWFDLPVKFDLDKKTDIWTLKLTGDERLCVVLQFLIRNLVSCARDAYDYKNVKDFDEFISDLVETARFQRHMSISEYISAVTCSRIFRERPYIATFPELSILMNSRYDKEPPPLRYSVFDISPIETITELDCLYSFDINIVVSYPGGSATLKPWVIYCEKPDAVRLKQMIDSVISQIFQNVTYPRYSEIFDIIPALVTYIVRKAAKLDISNRLKIIEENESWTEYAKEIIKWETVTGFEWSSELLKYLVLLELEGTDCVLDRLSQNKSRTFCNQLLRLIALRDYLFDEQLAPDIYIKGWPLKNEY